MLARSCFCTPPLHPSPPLLPETVVGHMHISKPGLLWSPTGVLPDATRCYPTLQGPTGLYSCHQGLLMHSHHCNSHPPPTPPQTHQQQQHQQQQQHNVCNTLLNGFFGQNGPGLIVAVLAGGHVGVGMLRIQLMGWCHLGGTCQVRRSGQVCRWQGS